MRFLVNPLSLLLRKKGEKQTKTGDTPTARLEKKKKKKKKEKLILFIQPCVQTKKISFKHSRQCFLIVSSRIIFCVNNLVFLFRVSRYEIECVCK